MSICTITSLCARRWITSAARASTRRRFITAYVIDDQRKLVGQVSLRKLIIAPESACIRDIMDTNIDAPVTTDDQEAVADDFRRYDLTSVAVCDKENRLVGIITIDDIVDVIQDEKHRGHQKDGRYHSERRRLYENQRLESVAHRLPWLMLLMISATFTSTSTPTLKRCFPARCCSPRSSRC